MASSPSLSRSFSTLGSPHLAWRDTLQFARKSGLDALEIRCLAGEVVEPVKFAQLLPAPEQARRDLEVAGLALAMLGTSVKLLQRTEYELENLSSFARLADQLGSPWLRIFDGGTIGESPSAETLAHTRKFLQDWAKIRSEHGFRCDLAVETHDAMAKLSASRDMLAALPHFNVLWDTHHTWRNGVDLAEYYQLVRDRTVHFHVKDSIDRPSKRKPFTYVEPGTGEFPWSSLGNLIADRSPAARISFEWEKHWNPELPAIEEVMPSFLRMTDSWR